MTDRLAQTGSAPGLLALLLLALTCATAGGGALTLTSAHRRRIA